MTLKDELCEYISLMKQLEKADLIDPNQILKLFEKLIDKKLRTIEEVNKQGSEGERLILLPTLMALTDLKKEINE